MNMNPGSAVGIATGESEHVQVEIEGRWDALALCEHLLSFHSFLVQRQGERWVVHARAPGRHGEDLSEALRAIDEWATERGAGSVACRVGDRRQRLGGHEPG
jgi:hypothetical protein